MSDPFLIPVVQPAAPINQAEAEADADTSDLWQRQHISALAFGLLGLLRSLLHLIPAIAALGLSGNSRYIPLAAAAYLALQIISVTAAWATTRYRISADSITLRFGIFARNERHIGFDRIQDISIEQNFLARALGVAKLGVETGAGGAGDDFTLYPIALPKAEALRETLRAYRQSHSAAAPESPPSPETTETAGTAATATSAATATAPEATPLFTMPPRQLLLSGLFAPSLGVIAFVFALLSFSDRFSALGFDPTQWQLWQRLAQKTGLDHPLNVEIGTSVVQLVALISLITLLLAFLGIFTGIIRAIFRDWDYRLTREPRALRRTRGLTTRTDVAITIRRIQSATITTGLIRQLFGWHELRLRSLASDIGGGEQGGDHQALPFAQMPQVNAVLDEIQMHPHWPAIAWQRSHMLIALPALIMGALLVLMGLAIVHFVSPYGWLTAGGGLLITLINLLAARRHFYAVDGRHMLIRSGLFRPATTIIPFAAIQSADICDNFVYRRFGLATLALGVPGISSFADDQARAIPLNQAHHLRAQILHQD